MFQSSCTTYFATEYHRLRLYSSILMLTNFPGTVNMTILRNFTHNSLLLNKYSIFNDILRFVWGYFPAGGYK